MLGNVVHLGTVELTADEPSSNRGTHVARHRNDCSGSSHRQSGYFHRLTCNLEQNVLLLPQVDAKLQTAPPDVSVYHGMALLAY
jgi:hypothetical protein